MHTCTSAWMENIHNYSSCGWFTSLNKKKNKQWIKKNTPVNLYPILMFYSHSNEYYFMYFFYDLDCFVSHADTIRSGITINFFSSENKINNVTLSPTPTSIDADVLLFFIQLFCFIFLWWACEQWMKSTSFWFSSPLFLNNSIGQFPQITDLLFFVQCEPKRCLSYWFWVRPVWVCILSNFLFSFFLSSLNSRLIRLSVEIAVIKSLKTMKNAIVAQAKNV